MNEKIIYEQINEYYKFHKNIESYFTQGFNENGRGERINLYILDLNFINLWKNYCNYDEVVKNLKTYDYDNMINRGILKNNNENSLPTFYGSGISSDIFLSKSIYEIKDFDCLTNVNSYESFYQNYGSLWNVNVEVIEGIFYDQILVLLINQQRRIKIFYRGQIKNKVELIHLILDFPKQKDSKSLIKEYFFDIILGNNDDSYFNFISAYIQDNCGKLLDFFEQNQISEFNYKKIELKDEKIEVEIYNINLDKNDYLNKQKSNIKSISLNNIDLIRMIGLENIGATCYMNATIQCLVNIDKLTRYLLNSEIFNNVIINSEKCEIVSCYCCLLEKLCCDENIKNYFAPYDFKNMISRKNPLFKGIQANDSKDLISFLIEQMNYEFNQINLKLIENIKFNETKEKNLVNIQTDRNIMLCEFIKQYSSMNNNIISNLFFSLIEYKTTCQGCNISKYNFQVSFSLEFILEKIYNGKYSNINTYLNNKKLSLDECFANYNEINYFNGENAMYCDFCKTQKNATYINTIYSLPPILIIILNRGKGNSFECDVDFPLQINVQKYVQYSKSNFNYSLIGVISHLGSSDMSGHFIAYCKHRITKEWHCYNDATVIRCDDQMNDYKKGVPYILFYESNQGNDNILFDYDDLNKTNSAKSNTFNNFNYKNQNMNFQNNFNNMNYINNNINNFNMLGNYDMNNANYNINMMPNNNMSMMSMNNMNMMTINNMNMMSMNNMNMMSINNMNNFNNIINMNNFNNTNNISMNNNNQMNYNCINNLIK